MVSWGSATAKDAVFCTTSGGAEGVKVKVKVKDITKEKLGMSPLTDRKHVG